ncbi:hypothetical protein A0H81_12965 [Grifola frondosa]|uniref:Uncharacterized protein n=1 Tax=Grifola frondosa TaxID=5627 RepID=A0A1C7LQI7_GRIFR|nr:hypothetical protein A0H81_12965 [Grifola frondosa]
MSILVVTATLHRFHFTSTNMPPRGHRSSSGQLRAHSRTSSGGSSKLALNLQFTQKDVPPPRILDKTKKSPHIHHEVAARATNAQHQRTSSGIRVQSRENIQPAALRRAPTPAAPAKPPGPKQKVGFSIASPSEGDDDEWVSSESGAATPEDESDVETTPIEPPVQPSIPRPVITHVNGFANHDIETPRAELVSLPRVDTARPSQPPLSPAPAARDSAQLQQSQVLHGPQPRQPERNDQRLPQAEPRVLIQQPTPTITKARSETHSPPRKSPDIRPKRQMHRCVRTRSSGGKLTASCGVFTAKPVALAPLTTVLSESAQAQMSTLSSPSSQRGGSPSSIKTASASPNQSSPSSSSPAHRQLRRTSTSSARSTATLPALPSASQAQLSKSNHDRQRTLSTISSASSVAALSHFALLSTPSPPRTPIQITVHFPPAEQTAHLEAIHPLLPPPYLSAHLTVLANRNPIAESYDRVIRAKQRRC